MELYWNPQFPARSKGWRAGQRTQSQPCRSRSPIYRSDGRGDGEGRALAVAQAGVDLRELARALSLIDTDED